MKLGLFAMPLHPPERSVADTYDDDVRTIQLAEQLGFEEVWIGEHFTSTWENIPSPDLFIARAAAQTERIRFGTGVVLMPFHDPMHVALRMAQLDQQTRGRLMVGFGSGGLAADKRAFGIDPTPEEAGKRTFEAVEAIVTLWGGEPCRHEGERFRIDVPEQDALGNGRLLRPYQQPHPPIAFAGVTARSFVLGLAGERGWIPLSTNFVPTSLVGQQWDAYAAGAARAGRDADPALWRIAREIHVAETSEQARREAREGGIARAWREYVLPLVSGNRGVEAFKESPSDEVTIDHLIEKVWIVGSPEECAAKLAGLPRFGVLLQVSHDWPNQARSMALLAEKVLPRLA
jgi:alkanesulfonate monooxygenase SsuD/methylene tetrahydromethanopterin reductase-like flavin-dependent oxidoreductase (luciferase family)